MRITGDTLIIPRLKAYASPISLLEQARQAAPPKRTAPFNEEPGFHEPANLWLYGNAKLLCGELAFLDGALGQPDQYPAELDELEKQAEEFILDGKVLVCGLHNAAQMRTALIPLRWGAPRIVVMSGGFRYHLGKDLKDEPFRAARLWRYQWDATTDLAISRRGPEKLPTYASYNPTVDKMIAKIASAQWPGLRWIDKDIIRVLA